MGQETRGHSSTAPLGGAGCGVRRQEAILTGLCNLESGGAPGAPPRSLGPTAAPRPPHGDGRPPPLYRGRTTVVGEPGPLQCPRLGSLGSPARLTLYQPADGWAVSHRCPPCLSSAITQQSAEPAVI